MVKRLVFNPHSDRFRAARNSDLELINEFIVTLQQMRQALSDSKSRSEQELNALKEIEKEWINGIYRLCKAIDYLIENIESYYYEFKDYHQPK